MATNPTGRKTATGTKTTGTRKTVKKKTQAKTPEKTGGIADFGRSLLNRLSQGSQAIDPERRRFLTTVGLSAAGGLVAPSVIGGTYNYLFSGDEAITNLKEDVQKLLEEGKIDQAKETLSTALDHYTQQEDFERVGKVSILIRDLNGETENGVFEVPNDEEVTKLRETNVLATTEKMTPKQRADLINKIRAQGVTSDRHSYNAAGTAPGAKLPVVDSPKNNSEKE